MITGPPAALREALAAPRWEVGDLALRDRHPDAPRSYLADGRVVVWLVDAPPGWSLALDAELADRPVPEVVLRRARSAGGQDGSAPLADAVAGLSAWTRAEVAAKLTGIPILLWLTTIGLGAATDEQAAARGLLIETTPGAEVVLSVGAGPWGARSALLA